MKIGDYIDFFDQRYNESAECLQKCRCAYDELSIQLPRLVQSLRLLRHEEEDPVLHLTLSVDELLAFEYQRVNMAKSMLDSLSTDFEQLGTHFSTMKDHFGSYAEAHSALLKNYTMPSLARLEQRGELLLQARVQFERSKVLVTKDALRQLTELSSCQFVSYNVYIYQEDAFLALSPAYRDRICEQFMLIKLPYGVNLVERLQSVVLQEDAENAQPPQPESRKTESVKADGWVGAAYSITRLYQTD